MPTAQQDFAPDLAIMVQSPRWLVKADSEAVLRRAIAEAARALGLPPMPDTELAVALTDDAAIRELNRTYRGIDRPTNVLAFEPPRRGPGGGPASLGDIAIAFETTAREAAADGKPFAHHLAHLAVHGFLHLMGYDHHVDDDAVEMERLERRILARLEIPDPYGPETETDRHA